MKQKCSCLATMSSNMYVWRTEGEAFNSKNTIPSIQHGGFSIMLWNCFAASGSAVLKKVNGIMKTEDYLRQLPKVLTWASLITCGLCQEADKCRWTSQILSRGVVKTVIRALPEAFGWLSKGPCWGKNVQMTFNQISQSLNQTSWMFFVTK